MLGTKPVFRLLPILAHHDNRCLDCGEAGEDQVEQYIRIGIYGRQSSTSELIIIQRPRNTASTIRKDLLPPKAAIRSARRSPNDHSCSSFASTSLVRSSCLWILFTTSCFREVRDLRKNNIPIMRRIFVHLQGAAKGAWLGLCNRSRNA
jgi:hypothetical protein